MINLRTAMTRKSVLIELLFVPSVSFILFSFIFIMIEILNYPIATVLIYVITMMRLMPLAKNFQSRFAQLAQYHPSLEKVQHMSERMSAEEDVLSGKTLMASKEKLLFKT